MLLFIINILNNFIILKLSLVFSVLVGCVRLLLSYKRENNVIFGLTNKIKLLFLKSLQFPIVYHSLIICSKITNLFFKSERLFDIITMISGLSLGLSMMFRVLLLSGYVIMGQTGLLLFFAINALFRSIVTLGLTLKTGGSTLWRQLVEHATRQRGGLSAFPTPKNTPDQNPFNTSQNNNSHDHHEFNTRKQQEDSDQRKRDKWARFGAMGSIFGGFGTVFGILTYSHTVSNDYENKYDRRAAEERQARDTREKALLNEIIDIKDIQIAKLTEERDKLKKDADTKV